MSTWVRAGLAWEELKQLRLTPEDGFVLSRLDVALTTEEVSALTGFPPDQAGAILERLARLGAVQTDAVLSHAGPAAVVDPVEEPVAAAPPEEGAAAEGEGTEAAEPAPGDAANAEAAEEADLPPANEATYRKIYHSQFRERPLNERINEAHRVAENELMAMCFDPEPSVLNALLENPRCGLEHARFAARWHATAAGLEAIAQRASYFSDPQLQRLLLRNVHASELLIRRVLGGRRMLDAYKASIDTDVPERGRSFARSVLRTKFGTSQGEERAWLICATEGRVLASLAGLTLDGRATSILCARSYTSALFVQNLARFGSCPPQLLAHLLRQPIVRRQQHLKNMLLQHPNTPTDAKRRI